MLTRLKKRRLALQESDDQGFTLIELLVVVVIIGVLIAIAIPLYLNYTKGSKDTSADSDLRGAVSTLELCNSQNGSYPTAAFALSASGAAGTCTAQTINLSSGTTFTYVPNSGNTAYIAYTSNSNGTSQNYCYSSAAGGSVQSIGKTAVNATTYAATCPAKS